MNRYEKRKKISYASLNCIIEAFYKNIEEVFRFVPEKVKRTFQCYSPFDIKVYTTRFLFGLILKVADSEEGLCDGEVQSLVADHPWAVDPLWSIGLDEYDPAEISKDLVLYVLDELTDECISRYDCYIDRYAAIMSACAECNETFDSSHVAEHIHFLLVDIIYYWNSSKRTEKEIRRQLGKLADSFYKSHSFFKKFCQDNDVTFNSPFTEKVYKG